MLEQPQKIGILAVNIAFITETVPHILSGAYNSRKIGCCMNISLHLWQSPLISPSRRLTCFGTFEFLTASNFSIMLSTLISTLRYILLFL